jgi:hypothetical protein
MHPGNTAVSRDEPQVPHERGHPTRRGPQHNRRRRSGLEHRALVDHGERRAERLRVSQLVRHQHRRHLPIRDQRADQRCQRPPQRQIKPRVRLVQQQRVAVRQQQPPERHPVPLPARQPRRHRREQVRDPEHRRQRLELVRRSRPGSPVPQVVPHRQVREQPGILPQQPDPPPPRRHDHAGPGQHPRKQLHPPGRHRHQPRDRLEHGRLPGPRRPEQCQPLARRHRQRAADGE